MAIALAWQTDKLALLLLDGNTNFFSPNGKIIN